MGHIQTFKQRFPDKVTPEMTEAYHPGKSKVVEFTINNAHYSKHGMSGITFYSSENEARKKKPYVTKAYLKIGRTVSNVSPPRRDDIIYMIANSPIKNQVLERFDKDERSAFFKAVDHVVKSGTAFNCFKTISQEFYEGHEREFCKNMHRIRFDAAIIQSGGITKYIVFNPDVISIVNR